MSSIVLKCEKFEQPIGKYVFRSTGFELEAGTIAHLYGLSDSGIDEFLYLVGGLQNLRHTTRPARGGRLIREEQKIPVEDLRYIQLLDRPLYEYTPIERARLIGIVFENPDLFIVGNTVLEDFYYSFAAVKMPCPPPQALQKYGLYENEKFKRQTVWLSGGERHRLNCASVIELSPELIIADLSNSNLDLRFMANLVEWIKDLSRKGKVVFLTGLHPGSVVGAKNISFVLKEGELLQEEPKSELFPTYEEEQRILRGLWVQRHVGNKIVLYVNRVCRPNITQPVSFELREREVLIIQGFNGCGKTTLGKILVGRVKGYEGDFTSDVAAQPILSLQYPERFFIMSDVQNELLDEELLCICGITNKQWPLHPRVLSRSQQKLLSAAIALSLSKSYVILDEPTCGMDFPSKQAFIKLLNHFNDKSVLIFTHDSAIFGLGKTIAWNDITV